MSQFKKYLKEMEARETDYARWVNEMKEFSDYEGEITNWKQIPEFIKGIELGQRQVVSTIAIPKNIRGKKNEMILNVVNMLRQKAIDLYDKEVFFTRHKETSIGFIKAADDEQGLIFLSFHQEGNVLNVEFFYNIFCQNTILDEFDQKKLSKINYNKKAAYLKTAILKRDLYKIGNTGVLIRPIYYIKELLLMTFLYFSIVNLGAITILTGVIFLGGIAYGLFKPVFPHVFEKITYWLEYINAYVINKEYDLSVYLQTNKNKEDNTVFAFLLILEISIILIFCGVAKFNILTDSKYKKTVNSEIKDQLNYTPSFISMTTSKHNFNEIRKNLNLKDSHRNFYSRILDAFKEIQSLYETQARLDLSE